MVVAGVAFVRPSWLRDLLGSSSVGTPVGPADTSAPGDLTSTPSPRAAGSLPPAASGTPIASRPAAGPSIGTVQGVNAAESTTFTVPTSGDPGVLVRLANGHIVAFDATCTHAGCPVEYVPQDKALECPCHGAAFDPANGGAVLAGPTNQPLLSLPITIDQKTGQIRLAG